MVASAQPVGTRYSTALGMCEITLGDVVIGVGTVRSVYVARPGEFPPTYRAARRRTATGGPRQRSWHSRSTMPTARR